MKAQTDHLSLFRVAPVQCVLAGHPITSGSPQIDYFISSVFWDSPASQSHYTETLYLTQKGLPMTYSSDYAIAITSPKSRLDLNLSETEHIYYCPMTLFKLHPDFDLALAGILEGDSKAQIYFAKEPEELVPNLKKRFKNTLGEWAQRIHFMPWLSREDFYQMLVLSDVVLDSFPFNGGNTSCICLLLEQPIVTLQGEFLRGRLTACYYQMMGLEEFIPKTIEAYIQLSLQLGTNPAFRRSLQQKIAQSKQVLLDNYQGIDETIKQFKVWTTEKRAL